MRVLISQEFGARLTASPRIFYILSYLCVSSFLFLTPSYFCAAAFLCPALTALPFLLFLSPQHTLLIYLIKRVSLDHDSRCHLSLPLSVSKYG